MSGKTVAGAWRQRLQVLRRLLGNKLWFAFFLMFVTLLSALAEMVGVSIVLPLVAALIGAQSDFGGLSRAIDALRTVLPSGYETESLLAILAFAFFVKGVLLTMTHGLADYFALSLRDNWAGRIFEHYLTARYDTLSREKQGKLVHNLTVEPYLAGRGMEALLALINRVVMTAVLFGLMLTVSWEATLAVGAIGGSVFYLLRGWTMRQSLRAGKAQQRSQAEVTSIATEAMAAGVEIRLFGAADRMRARLLTHFRQHTLAESRFRLLKEVPVQMTEFFLILMLAVTLIVMTRVLEMNSASYIATLAFFLLVSQRLLSNFTGLLAQRMKVAAYLPPMKLVDDLLRDEPYRERAHEGATFEGLDGDIEFRDVTFAYEPGRDVLRGLSLTFPKGRTTAIVGPSGIGKSTLADLLLGLIAPQSGTIHLGSRPLSEFSLASLRRRVGYVSQHPVIFNGTVRDNLLFAAPRASAEEISAALRIARADGFVARLPQGLDTPIGDRGATLSGGERQRLALARIVLRRPTIYVFDEATSALDPESEAYIRESVRTLAGQATVIVIAHRHSAVAGADVVYRLGPDGARPVRLSEVGT